MTAEAIAGHHEDEGLRRNAVGLPDVLFTSVTTMAPPANSAPTVMENAAPAASAPRSGSWPAGGSTSPTRWWSRW